MAHLTVELAAPPLAASAPTLARGLGSQRARTVVNDDDADAAAEFSNADRNPLRVILIGMACFFAVAAAVIALG